MIIHLFNATIVSGPETLVIPALQSLSARMETSVEVWFLHETRRAAESNRIIEYAKGFGLQTRSFDVHSRWDPATIRALGDALLDGMILHAHDVKASAYARAAVLRQRRKNDFKVHLVSTHHGVRGRSGWKPRFYEWFYVRWVLRDFDRVLAVCSSDRALLIRRGLDAGRVVIHLNGVDREETVFSTAATNTASQCALPND
ncbi:glycosyltransferase [candidate division KSB1 bacterium]|nr:glycosyltransferase [candidate division KSB1 bacterium]